MHAYAIFVGYDVTNITFRTFHWYKCKYTDVPRPFRFTCEDLASQTMAKLRMAIGDECGRGMCLLPPKAEAFDAFRFTTVNFCCFLSVFT